MDKCQRVRVVLNEAEAGDAGKYEKGVMYTATVPYKEEYISDPNGTFLDPQRNHYRREITQAENKKGYLAVKNAVEGSRITVHFPKSLEEYGISEHDEYYEVRRVKYGDGSISKFLHLEFTGSTLPNNRQTLRHGVRTDKTSNIREFLGLSDRITIEAPKVRPKSYEEQLAERRAENARKYGWIIS